MNGFNFPKRFIAFDFVSLVGIVSNIYQFKIKFGSFIISRAEYDKQLVAERWMKFYGQTFEQPSASQS